MLADVMMLSLVIFISSIMFYGVYKLDKTYNNKSAH
jgi:hypothetical protein